MWGWLGKVNKSIKYELLIKTGLKVSINILLECRTMNLSFMEANWRVKIGTALKKTLDGGGGGLFVFFEFINAFFPCHSHYVFSLSVCLSFFFYFFRAEIEKQAIGGEEGNSGEKNMTMQKELANNPTTFIPHCYLSIRLNSTVRKKQISKSRRRQGNNNSMPFVALSLRQPMSV